MEIITNQGKEFCAKPTKDLFQFLQITHSTTTAYNPQCNSQADVANKKIDKFLTSNISNTTPDWEDYLALMMFSYNTPFHQSVRNTPFFLTHGMEARQPMFDARTCICMLTCSPQTNWETSFCNSRISPSRKMVSFLFLNQPIFFSFKSLIYFW